MIRLDWYVGKTLFAATLLAWSVMIVLDSLFRFLGELGDVGRGDYALGDAAVYTLLSVPTGAWQIFPMAVLIGSLIGLGSLASQRELTAFRLAGCSPMRLLWAALQVGLLMLIAAALVGELLAPPSAQLAAGLRASALHGNLGMQSGAGFWVREGDRMIRVGNSAADGDLTDIRIFELGTTPGLRSATAIAAARYRGGEWLLQDVRETVFAQQRIEISRSAEQRTERLVPSALAQLLSRDVQTLNLIDLRRYAQYLHRNGSDVGPAWLNYWQRVSAPLAVIAMLVLSVSLVLGPLGRQSVGKRVLSGVLIGLAFKLFNDISAYAGLVLGIPPWINALSASLLVSMIGLLLLRRFS